VVNAIAYLRTHLVALEYALERKNIIGYVAYKLAIE
jgi:hypothetical protein